jgi:hypothetical protein
MSNTPDMRSFGKFVPGFDFLQNLAKQAAGGAAQSMPQLPNLGHWVAPTLNVEELDKRIEELKAVQFWLDQNATALKATIQALEVQKMTLATLKGMNFNLGDVANAFKLKAADAVISGVKKVTRKTTSNTTGKTTVKTSPKSATSSVAASSGLDPVQLWGALTQQFSQIAAAAMKDAAKQTAMDVTKDVAKGVAKSALKKASSMAGAVGKAMTTSAKSAPKSAPKQPIKKTAPKKRTS